MIARLRNLFEVVLLFTALFVLVFPVAARDPLVDRPVGLSIVAVSAFVASRALRWRQQWYFAFAEAVAFVSFILVLQQSAALIRQAAA